MESGTSSASIRLKHFLDYTGLSNSQFADACAIPRPTLSQLLSGRNKKLSDHLLRPIHERFPQLSLLWLMFGEGDMLIQSSDSMNDIAPVCHADGDVGTSPADFFANAESDVNRMSNNSKDIESCQKSCDDSAADALAGEKLDVAYLGQQTFKLPSKAIRKVKNIVVYYDDNTYETFCPDVADC